MRLDPKAAARRKNNRSIDQGMVVVVDDDFDTRAALAELLTGMRFWPVGTRNGLEALAFLKRAVRPVALVIDLQMPEMDGEALCDACDADDTLAGIPRIIVSARTDGASRVGRCQAIGFLPKPMVLERFCELLNRAKECTPESADPVVR